MTTLSSSSRYSLTESPNGYIFILLIRKQNSRLQDIQSAITEYLNLSFGNWLKSFSIRFLSPQINGFKIQDNNQSFTQRTEKPKYTWL